MKQYIVQITDKALADMEEIYIYIAEQLLAPDSATGQYNRIAEAIQNLNIFPERIRVMESEPEHTMGLRQQEIVIVFILCGFRLVHHVSGIFPHASLRIIKAHSELYSHAPFPLSYLF